MVSCGVAENAASCGKLLKGLVGAWGFEPQTPTVSRYCSTGRGASCYQHLRNSSIKFAVHSHCTHCIHCFNCSLSTFLCAKLCAHSYITTCSRPNSFRVVFF